MALESVVQQQDSFGYDCKEFYTLGGSVSWGYEIDLQEEEEEEEDKALVGVFGNNLDHALNGSYRDSSSSSPLMQNVKEWNPNPSVLVMEEQMATSGRGKRRRTKNCRNNEELENQRMTHITVERNRRKQMNDYLAIIRSMMPPSYVQRSDQASTIEGAINFVKEMEQLLQTLEARKRTNQQPNNGSSQLFRDFFTFPQYSMSSTSTHPNNSPEIAENRSAALADIEVSMAAESHATLKILSRRQPKQVLKMLAGLHCLQLTVLHLNITTVDQMVLYSISVKIEHGCQLSTADEIADAVNHLVGNIQEEAA